MRKNSSNDPNSSKKRRREKKNNGIGEALKYCGDRSVHAKLSIGLSVISTLLTFGPYVALWFTASVVVNALPQLPDYNALVRFALVAVISAALGVGLYALALVLSHTVAFRASSNMKKQALEQVTKLPLSFFSNNTSAHIRRLIDDNTSAVETFLSHQLPDLAGAFTTLLVTIIILFLFDWRLGLASLIPVIIGFVFMGTAMNERQMKINRDFEAQKEVLSAQAIEYVRGIPVVKMFQQTVYSFQNFHREIVKFRELSNGVTKGMEFSFVVYSVLMNTIFVFLVPVGILIYNRTAARNEFVTDFLFYLMIVPIIPTMMNKVMRVMDDVMKVNASINTLNELMETETVTYGEEENSQNKGISFEKVSYSYAGADKKAADSISFEVKPGESLAIVGASGSGKSTVAALAARLLDADEGEVKIGDRDIKSLSKEELTACVSFVFQTTKLLSTSLYENITMGNTNVTREAVMEALRRAHCMDIIDALPEGLDTLYGSKGVYLSGGECQRIALARAILKDSPIVILDEATAFADPENERLIQQSFEELTRDKTLIMIAHRLTTVKDAARIIVMDEGKIVERGDHSELMERNGIYRKMWDEYMQSTSWNMKEEAV